MFDHRVLYLLFQNSTCKVTCVSVQNYQQAADKWYTNATPKRLGPITTQNVKLCCYTMLYLLLVINKHIFTDRKRKNRHTNGINYKLIIRVGATYGFKDNRAIFQIPSKSKSKVNVNKYMDNP